MHVIVQTVVIRQTTVQPSKITAKESLIIHLAYPKPRPNRSTLLVNPVEKPLILGSAMKDTKTKSMKEVHCT